MKLQKPAPPLTPAAKNSTISKIQGGTYWVPDLSKRILFCYVFLFLFIITDADRARKHGMEEYISADPCKYDHHNLFKNLQTQTLDFRLADPYCSLVSERSGGESQNYLAQTSCFPVYSGLVQPRPAIRVGRVLRPLRRAWLLPAPFVPWGSS